MTSSLKKETICSNASAVIASQIRHPFAHRLLLLVSPLASWPTCLFDTAGLYLSPCRSERHFALGCYQNSIVVYSSHLPGLESKHDFNIRLVPRQNKAWSDHTYLKWGCRRAGGNRALSKNPEIAGKNKRWAGVRQVSNAANFIRQQRNLYIETKRAGRSITTRTRHSNQTLGTQFQKQLCVWGKYEIVSGIEYELIWIVSSFSELILFVVLLTLFVAIYICSFIIEKKIAVLETCCSLVLLFFSPQSLRFLAIPAETSLWGSSIACCSPSKTIFIPLY